MLFVGIPVHCLEKSCTKIDLQIRAGGMIRTTKQQLNSQGYPRNWFIHKKKRFKTGIIMPPGRKPGVSARAFVLGSCSKCYGMDCFGTYSHMSKVVM